MSLFVRYLPAFVFIIFSIMMSVCDLRTKTVPRWMSFSLLGLMIFLPLLNLIFTGVSVPAVRDYILRPIVAGCFGLLLFWLVRLICRKKLGLADVWFSGSMGFLLCLNWYIVAAGLSCVLFFLYYLGLSFSFSKQKGKSVFDSLKLPFIPFLTAGSIIILIIKLKIS